MASKSRKSRNRSAKNKPGRPPGSRNKTYAAVEEIPATCSKCNSPKLVKVEGAKVIGPRPIRGTTRNGFIYASVSHTRKCCSDCGQFQVVRAYYAELAATAEN